MSQPRVFGWLSVRLILIYYKMLVFLCVLRENSYFCGCWMSWSFLGYKGYSNEKPVKIYEWFIGCSLLSWHFSYVKSQIHISNVNLWRERYILIRYIFACWYFQCLLRNVRTFLHAINVNIIRLTAVKLSP